MNSNIIEDAKRKKDEFQKNKYKFEGMNEGRIGRESDGMLKINKKDLARINGKDMGRGKKKQHQHNQSPHSNRVDGKGFNKQKKVNH